MRITFSHRSIREYAKLSRDIQLKFNKQVTFLMANVRHPSLRSKKYSETERIWQARVDDHYRFYFRIQGDTYEILDIAAHPK